MTQPAPKQRSQRGTRRRTSVSGHPQLAAKLPGDFRSASNVNDFIYSLAAEFTAGRVESRSAAILGYLTQLAIQTIPQLQREAQIAEDSKPFEFVSYIPRPDYSKCLAEQEAKKAAETAATTHDSGQR